MFITIPVLDRIDLNKPRNKRSDKQLILSGAQGKHARRESRGPSHNQLRRERRWAQQADLDEAGQKKPVLNRQQAIKDQLDEGQPLVEAPRRRQRSSSVSTVAPENNVRYTTESSRFKVQPEKRFEQVSSPQPPADLPMPDDHLPVIVVCSEDAWQLCGRYHR